MAQRVRVPAGLDSRRVLGEPWESWLDLLPSLAQGLLAEWALTLDGEAMHGHCSLVLPTRTKAGQPTVLKLALPDREAEHEHLALQRWAGAGAVRLLRAEPHRRAMVLERLSTRSLGEEWDQTACEVVAERYAALHVPASPQFRLLSGEVRRWHEQLAALPREVPLPRRMVDQALTLTRDLAADPDTDGTLIHTDLHYDNVLAASDDPIESERPGNWVVIDPKPLSGDPHFEPAPMLWNRFDELAGDVRDGVRRRFHTLIDTSGLDEHRARDWVIVRMMMNACWRLRDPGGDRRHTETKEWLTMCLAIAKAVQD